MEYLGSLIGKHFPVLTQSFLHRALNAPSSHLCDEFYDNKHFILIMWNARDGFNVNSHHLAVVETFKICFAPMRQIKCQWWKLAAFIHKVHFYLNTWCRRYWKVQITDGWLHTILAEWTLWTGVPFTQDQLGTIDSSTNCKESLSILKELFSKRALLRRYQTNKASFSRPKSSCFVDFCKMLAEICKLGWICG